MVARETTATTGVSTPVCKTVVQMWKRGPWNSPGASDPSDGPSDIHQKFREVKSPRHDSLQVDALFCKYKRDMRKNEGKHIAPNLACARKSAATISDTDTSPTGPAPAPRHT